MAKIAAGLAVSSAALAFLGSLFSSIVGFILFFLASLPAVLLLVLVIVWCRPPEPPREASAKIEQTGVEWHIDGVLWRRLDWTDIVEAPDGGYDLRYLDLGDGEEGIGFFVHDQNGPESLIVAPFSNLFPLEESHHLPHFRNVSDLRYSFFVTFARARPDLAIDPEVFIGLRIDPRSLSHAPRAFRKIVVRRTIANLAFVIVSFAGMGLTMYGLIAAIPSLKSAPGCLLSAAGFLIVLLGSALSLYLGFKLQGLLYDDGHGGHPR